MPPPPLAVSAIVAAAFASGISEISRKSYWPSVKCIESNLPPACSQSLERAACRSSGFARPDFTYSRVNRPCVTKIGIGKPPCSDISHAQGGLIGTKLSRHLPVDRVIEHHCNPSGHPSPERSTTDLPPFCPPLAGPRRGDRTLAERVLAKLKR